MALVVKQQSVDAEYKKNPDIKKEDVAKLAEWLERQPHLPKLQELELILFYHSCQSSMELTKQTIDLHYTMKTHWSDLFDNYDPKNPKTVHMLESTMVTPLPGVTKEGYKVLYGRLMDYEPANFFLDVGAKITIMIGELMLMEEGTFPGVVIMLDMEGIVFGHVGRLGLMAIKKILNFLQEAVPMRLKGFHFLNTPPFMDKILTLLKPFAKKQLIDMLHLHPAPIDSVFEYVPKENFPKEIGGVGKTNEEFRKHIQDWLVANREILMERGKLKVDESKRPDKPKYVSDITGIEGSFKKLDID